MQQTFFIKVKDEKYKIVMFCIRYILSFYYYYYYVLLPIIYNSLSLLILQY